MLCVYGLSEVNKSCCFITGCEGQGPSSESYIKSCCFISGSEGQGPNSESHIKSYCFINACEDQGPKAESYIENGLSSISKMIVYEQMGG